MEKHELRLLIESAQSGSARAKNELVRALRNNGCMKQLNRYLYLNRLLEPDEVRSEFWMGVTLAIPRVKHDIGSPLQYLTQMGLYQVKSALRRAITTQCAYQCLDCGHEGQLRRREDIDAIYRGGKPFKCSACGSESVETYQQTTYLENKEIPVPNTTKHKIDLETFKLQLSPQERRVLELILNGTDRDASKNYLKEIATELGISAQCVTIYLRKIREKFGEYYK